MRLYVDSASESEARPLLEGGLCHGVTTNPTLLQRAGVTESELPQLYAWATAAGAEEVFLQTWGDDVRTMVARAVRLRAIGERVVVKVPISRIGLRVIAGLHEQACPVLATAVYNARQVIAAAAAGASYAAPYLGRMIDNGIDGVGEVTRMHRVLTGVDDGMRLLVASIREPAQVVELAEAGVANFAMSPRLASMMVDDPLTDGAIRDFDAAAASLA